MAWLSWDKMCESKECGGMGFKELKSFNLALLAKQGWRLQIGHNSLLYRVLKAKYFPNGDFLHATLGSNPSFTWRSILSAQAIVKQGVRWRVGNGKNIRIWGEKWLPRMSSYEVISPRIFLHQDTRVSELINTASKSWNEVVVRQLFLPVDADTILSIPLSDRLPEDRLIWAETNNGCFSVRSAYRVAMSLKHTDQSASVSSDSLQRRFWRKVWHLPIPHKVRHFAWRACRNILPTKEILCHRKVIRDSICEECGEDTESSGHLFWSCSKAQLVWNCSKLPSSLRSGQFHSFFELLWFLLMIESFDDDKVALVVTIAWAMWTNRNSVRHGGIRKSPEAIVHWASHYLIDYTSATESHVISPELFQAIWTPPPFSVLKINVDGAFSKHSGSAGVGVVIRDDAGHCVAALSKNLHAPLGPLEAEAKAFEAGLHLAWDLGCQNVVLEGDSLVMVRALCGQSIPPSSVDAVCLGMQQISMEFHSVTYSHVRRQGNRPAHILAQFALSLVESLVWIGESPPCIVQALIQDTVLVPFG